MAKEDYTSQAMARSVPLPPPGFDDLSVDEKLDYVQSLWNRIDSDHEDEPVSDWQMQIVLERRAEYEANPDEGNVSLEELRGMLSRKPGDLSGR